MSAWMVWGTVLVLTSLQFIHLRADPKYSRKCWVRLGNMTLAEEPFSEVKSPEEREWVEIRGLPHLPTDPEF